MQMLGTSGSTMMMSTISCVILLAGPHLCRRPKVICKSMQTAGERRRRCLGSIDAWVREEGVMDCLDISLT